MQKNKVVKIIHSLSAEEIRQFDKFVRSPVHNQHTDVTRLFHYLRKHLNGGERALKREHVFKGLFLEEAFDMQKIHHVSSYLLKVLEEFLAWRQWRKDETSYGLHLIKSYQQHKLEDEFRGSLKTTTALHQKKALRDSQYFRQQYLLNFEDYNFLRASGRTRDFNLQELSDTQDIAFLVEKLKNACLLQSHQAVAQANYDTSFLQSILHFLDGHHFLETPAIAFFYHAYQALSDLQNESSFAILKKMLVETAGLFRKEDLRDLYILTINCCIKRRNSGDETYLKELFEIYKMGLQTDVFIDNGVLSPWTYKNFVQSGLMLKEFETVEKFMVEYKALLPEDQRENFFNLNFAWLHYGKKDYKKALQLLLQMDIGKDLLTACAVKTLIARIHFEQKEYDLLASHLQSFKVFIGRKKILAYHRDLYLNFTQFLQKMANANFSDKESKRKLVEEIRDTKVVAAKEWLIEQLEA